MSISDIIKLERVLLPVPDSANDFPNYVHLKRSKRARRVALRLDTKARRFNLVVPDFMSVKKAQAFAAEHDTWMQETLAELPSGTPFEHDAEIPVLGQMRRIRVDWHNIKRTSVDLDDDLLIVQTHLDDPSARIQRFLKETARDVMDEMAREKAALIRKKIRTVEVRDTKSRWGSCSTDKRIMLSWRLILAPYEAMDYVVAHEVAHLQHMDHSDRFWALCEELSDDYEEGKYWMRNHAQELMAFGVG